MSLFMNEKLSETTDLRQAPLFSTFCNLHLLYSVYTGGSHSTNSSSYAMPIDNFLNISNPFIAFQVILFTNRQINTAVI